MTSAEQNRILELATKYRAKRNVLTHQLENYSGMVKDIDSHLREMRLLEDVMHDLDQLAVQ